MLEETRWLLDLNEAVVAAADAAANEACREAQDRPGIESGDCAGLFYSDKDDYRSYSKSVADYLRFELKDAGLRRVDVRPM